MTAISNKRRGFSVLEVMMALALALVSTAAAFSTIQMVDYWVLGSTVAGGARSLAAEEIAIARHLLATDFISVSTTPITRVTATSTPLTQSCVAGGACYYWARTVENISACATALTVDVSWRLGLRYPTSTVSMATYGVNQSDLVARGGDCVVSPLPMEWGSTTSLLVAYTATSAPAFETGIDVLDGRLYVVASSAPQLRIYDMLSGTTPHLLITSNLLGNRLNAIDVIRDAATGRRYAYIMQHTKTKQLLVLDVTGDIPVITATASLLGTDPLGSFPQGWRVVAYGDRLYVTTRETAGAELHIFSIAHPSAPTQITSGSVNLARTVNDMAVVERLGSDGYVHRYVALAASAALKELALFEVTNDTPVERVARDLPGTENALSIAVNGSDLWLGRQVVTSGPELYYYDMPALLSGSSIPLATSEVGADVHTLRPVGSLLMLGTNKSGAELQVWRTSAAMWSPIVANAGRVKALPVSRLAPLGIDVASSTVITISQSATQPEQCTIWSSQ